MPENKEPDNEELIEAIARLQKSVDEAMRVIPFFQKQWNDLNHYLVESEQREIETKEAIVRFLQAYAELDAKRIKTTVKAAQVSERTAKIVLGVFILVGLVALFVIYGDPYRFQEELQKWYGLFVPLMVVAICELFGIDIQKIFDLVMGINGKGRDDKED